MIHYLPSIYSQKEGFEHLASLASATSDLFGDYLEINLNNCTFFDANMAAPFAAILARVADRFNEIKIMEIPTMIERILRKNRFLVAYGYSPIEDIYRTTLPFIRLQRTDEGRFSDYIGRHMRGKGIPRMSESLGKVFRQSIFEVFQNAVLHSESDLGIFVCGQFYPTLQRLNLTIADAGIGIRTAVRRYLQSKISSMDAIRWALKEGHTTKTGKQPGGIGLKFIKDFIELNRGKIHIVSRLGFYSYSEGREEFSKLDADFPGTTINIEINTSDTKAYCLSEEVDPEEIF